MRPPDDENSDDEFPLGDGTADTAVTVQCPYCWQELEITVDPSGGPSQEYEEDCEVCCRPWRVNLEYDEDGTASVTLTANEE